jgi:hypothetical protein
MIKIRKIIKNQRNYYKNQYFSLSDQKNLNLSLNSTYLTDIIELIIWLAIVNSKLKRKKE